MMPGQHALNVFLLHFGELVLDGSVTSCVVDVAGDVIEFARELLPQVLVEGAVFKELLHAFVHLLPEGFVGDFFSSLGAHLPLPPDFAEPPVLWGDPAHVRGLFQGTGVDLDIERDDVEFRFESVEHAVGYYEVNFGPVIMTRELLAPEGRWGAARADFAAMYAGHAGTDGSLDFPGEYLVILGRKK